MKKNYAFLLTGLVFSQLIQAQTLTKTLNEPTAGDIHITAEYDSTTAIPRNTGSNQQWNFSSLLSNSSTQTTTFVAASSVPSSSTFPGATLAEDQGGGDYTFYKSTATPTAQFESLGYGSSASPAVNISFTNSAIQYIWPVTYGNSYTDSFSGKLTGAATGNLNGSFTTTASGSGTIVLPGGASYPNILQLKTTRKTNASFSAPFPTSYTTTEIQYDYFEPSQKFPLLTVLVSMEDFGGSLDTSITITGNKIITVGITDRNFDAEYAIYPNPAKDNFNLKLSNSSNQACSIEIYNSTGQLVKALSLGNESSIEKNIPIYDLVTGIYMVKTSLGQKSSVRRLLVE